MQLRTFFLLLWMFASFPLFAQQMFVEEFTKVKSEGVKSKLFAIVDLYTNEKGFTFTQGKNPIESQEGEGFIRLMVPHKSTFVNIEHPDYGKLAWKIPNTELKKKTRYKAYLRTESIDKEFKLTKQWALFHIHPEHAILYLDTLMHTTETGHLSFYLPVGKHACRILSPFYCELTDTIEVTDSVRFERDFYLKPYLSYLSVETENPEACILLNNKEIGWGSAQTSRIQPGKYLLEVLLHGQPCYSREVTLANAEKKVVTIRQHELRPVFTSVQSTATPVAKNQPSTSVQPPKTAAQQSLKASQSLPANQPAKVYVKAFDDESEIWINRENYGTGSWEGTLAPGFYSLSSHKKGYDSKTYYFWVESGKELELNLKSPLADYGMLNISSNQMDAVVFINGIAVDRTPCVIQNLPAHQSYHIILVKGNMRAEQLVRLHANDILHVKLNLK